MVRVGRDLKDHLVPTPLPWAGTSPTRPGCSELHPACLWTLPGRGQPQLLWTTCASVWPPSWGRIMWAPVLTNTPVRESFSESLLLTVTQGGGRLDFLRLGADRSTPDSCTELNGSQQLREGCSLSCFHSFCCGLTVSSKRAKRKQFSS